MFKSLGDVHDGPISALSLSPFNKDLMLSVGGRVVAIWKDTVKVWSLFAVEVYMSFLLLQFTKTANDKNEAFVYHCYVNVSFRIFQSCGEGLVPHWPVGHGHYSALVCFTSHVSMVPWKFGIFLCKATSHWWSRASQGVHLLVCNKSYDKYKACWICKVPCPVTLP